MSIIFTDSIKSISWEQQKTILENTINHNLNIIAPIKSSYQIAFLKKVIEYLESRNVEIHDEIYEKLCTLQSISSNKNTFAFKHYLLPIFNVEISLKESNNFVSDGTTGLCSWQASLALSDWLMQNKSIISDKHVLELGSGTGLCGFIASKCCGPRKIVMSDGSTKVIELLKNNLERNYVYDDIQYLKDDYALYRINEIIQIGVLLLPWENIESLSLENIIKPDVILAADVVYDSSIFLTLSNALTYLFNFMNNDCKLILAATVRNEETLSNFINILDKLGFLISKQSVSSRYLFWDKNTRIELFVITRKNK